MQKTIPYYDRKKKLWRVRFPECEKDGLFYPAEEGTLEYVVTEYVKGCLFFPFWQGNKVYKDFDAHAHSFEGVLRSLLDDPVTFSIKGFEEYYSTQEMKLLLKFQKKLLSDIHKIVVLIRHGESVANSGLPTSDPASIPLTETGWLQAEQIAEKMTIVPDLIIVSPYLRAKQTAEPMTNRFPQAKVECWPEVREFTYLSPASCAGTTTEDRKERVKSYWKAANPCYVDGEGAESFSQFVQRVDLVLQKLDNVEAKNILVFTHGQFMRALKSEYGDRSFRKMSSRKKMELYRDLADVRVVDNAEMMLLKM